MENESNTAPARVHTAYDLKALTATNNDPQVSSHEIGAFSAQGAAGVQMAARRVERSKDKLESKGTAGREHQ